MDQQEDYIYQMTKVAFQMYSAIFVLNFMEMNGGQEGGLGQRHTAAKAMLLHETSNLQRLQLYKHTF